MFFNPSERIALMSIKPVYANAILASRKRVEFRKRCLAQDISTVIIYETSPTKLVTGMFFVAGQQVAEPISLWEQHEPYAGISRHDYLNYYGETNKAVGILVENPTPLIEPIPLSRLANKKVCAPQSFTYLLASDLRPDWIHTLRSRVAQR
jgi:predicted transcriptional regulator